MAGVSHIAPVVTARTLVKVNALRRAHAADRWHRIAVASAKQCRRARIPAIDFARPLAEWLAAPFDGPRLLLVEPAGAADQGSVKMLRDLQAGPRPAAAACLIGPEGGWTADERAAALAGGCTPVTLGTMTFRANAAALIAMGALTVVWGD
jgi:16S rRNA (uracil1498-N3)-methyltransferase